MSERVIPATILPIPCGQIGYELSARHIFTLIKDARRLFIRGGGVHEVRSDATGSHLAPVSADRLCVLLETFAVPDEFAAKTPQFAGKPMRVARFRDEDGKISWNPATFPENSARKLLVSDAAAELLPNIRQLVTAPVFTSSGTLQHGYHAHAGGTFVLSRESVSLPPLPLAVKALADLLEDFDFPDAGDRARALAGLISPALKFGGWIDDDFPLDIAEADASQSGKTYRQRLVCAIYGEDPVVITPSRGGVGSLDEAIAAAMIRGRPFVNLGNFRGKLDSTILEEALRGGRFIYCRTYRDSANVDRSSFLWQLSTNGAELTRDVANRSIITRIRKRPDRHVFKAWPEGDLLAHVAARQPFYLGCVFSIVDEWQKHGCSRTDESRHDFRTWCQVLDWIVQRIFNTAPLLQGHREEQLRTANPALQWLRGVVQLMIEAGHIGIGLGAADLAAMCEENDAQPPGANGGKTPLDMRIGSVLGRLFRESKGEPIHVDGHLFCRQISYERDPERRKEVERKTYFIDPVAPNAPNTIQSL